MRPRGSESNSALPAASVPPLINQIRRSSSWMSSAVFMLFCHVLKCVLWTRKTSLSSLSQLAFNFGCFFLCRFQTVVWSCAIRTPRHLDFLLIWPFLIVFSSSSQPGPWVAKGTVWPGGGPGHKRAAGFVLRWTGLSPGQPGGLWALPSLHHPKLRSPNTQLLPASQTCPETCLLPSPDQALSQP